MPALAFAGKRVFPSPEGKGDTLCADRVVPSPFCFVAEVNLDRKALSFTHPSSAFGKAGELVGALRNVPNHDRIDDENEQDKDE